MTQASRLEIIIDSRKAKKEVDDLDKALSNVETHGDKASNSVQKVGNEANVAAGKFSALKKQLIESLGNTRFGGMINDVNAKLATLNGTSGVVAASLAGLAVGGVATATSALTLMAIQSAKADAQLAVLANRANVSTTNFQILEHAAAQLGMSQDGLAQSLADAQEKLGEFTATGGSGEAADFFDALKNNTKMTDEEIKKFAKTLQGKDGVEVLQIMKDKLDELGASAQEQRFVFESLGNDLGNLLPLFANGGILLDEFGEALIDAGVIKSKEAIAQSKILAAQTQAVNLQFQGAKNELVQGFTPSLTSLAEAMFASSENGVTLKDVGAGLGTVFKTVGTIALGVAASVKVLGNGLGGLAAITDRLIARDFKGAKAIFDELDNNSAAAFDDLYMRADKIWNVTNASTSSTSKLTNALLGLNSATEQNNQSLKINVKDAKDAEKAALDAAKAKEQLTKQTQRLNEQLAKEQAQSRASISYGFADDLERLNIDYQKQIQEINHADFKGEREKYLKLAQDRYDFSTEMYLRQLTEENDSFRWSEEYKLKFYYDTQREIASKSGRFNDEMKELRMQKLNEQEQQELALIKLAQEQRLFQSRLFLMSETDAIRERYRLERKEIELTVKDESELRKRLTLSKDQEQLELLTRAAQATKNWQSTYSELTGNSQMFQLDQTRQDRTGQSLALADSQNADVMVRAQDPNADLEALAAEQEAIWQAHRDRMALIDQDYWGKTKAYQLGMAADVFGGLSGVMLNFVDESSSSYRMMIAAQKGANLASVFMSNLTAISAAWSSAPFPANLPAVALTTAKTGVLQATLQAFTPQGFATGGQIRGPGTTTSDSIPIMASDKEFMFKASSAASIGLENLNYMNKTGELPPNHDAAQLSAIQRQQRQSDLINTSINQRNAASTQSAAPTVVDNQMVVNNVFNPKDIPDAMATPYGAKVFMNFIKLNKSSIRGMLGV